MKPPPYISIFQDGWIRIEGDISRIPALCSLIASIPYGYQGVLFDDKGDYLKNIGLIQALMNLNELGVAFGEDYKQMMDPAGFMKELQRKFILRSAFTSIYWTGLDSWHLRDNEAEQSVAGYPPQGVGYPDP